MKMTGILKSAIFTLIALFIMIGQIQAVPLREDIVAKLREEGKLDEYIRAMSDVRARGVDQPIQKQFQINISSGTADEIPDTMRAVVLLVEFPDNPADDVSGVYVEPAYFDRLFNYEGLMPDEGCYKSMREFYRENSYGQFIFIADVYGWYMLDSSYAYYVDGNRGFGDYPQNAQGLAEDAVKKADPDIDYSLYDSDGNNYVDALILVHAGPGYEETGNLNDIHSHMWNLHSTYTSDEGTYIRDYNMNPEETIDGSVVGLNERNPIKIGVFCHEFGHTLGLPDLYDTDYSSSGVGNWSLMASGSYNGGSAVPAGFDAWCKVNLGWILPDTISANEMNHAFPNVYTSGYAARLWTDGDGGREYFLIENRQKTGFDSTLPGEGLLIWHVDETNWGNTREGDYLVALEQADGLFQLENSSNAKGDPNDPYPGNLGVREFSETTVPNTLTNPYGSESLRDSTYVAVWNISDLGDIMYASLDVNYSRPRFVLVDNYTAEISGDGDQYPEAGEVFGIYVKFTNIRADVENVTLSMTIADPFINLDNSSVVFTNVNAGDTVDNYDNPLVFSIDPDLEETITTFSLDIRDESSLDSLEYSAPLYVGKPRILIVAQDDENGVSQSYTSYYMDIFDSLLTPYEIYDRDVLGTPGSEMMEFPIMIWYVSTDSLEESDVDFLEAYLDQGGSLFLNGPNIAEGLAAGPDSLFLKNYLKCSYYGNGGLNHRKMGGLEGSKVGEEFYLQISAGDGVWDQDSTDILDDINPEAVASFKYKSGTTEPEIAGIEYKGDYRLVFWGFSFEAVASDLLYRNTRMEVMQNIIAFFEDIVTGVDDIDDDNTVLPREFTLEQNYPNPFNPHTVISYQLNHRMNNVSLKIYNLLGQEVKTYDEGAREAGIYRVEWDGTDNNGRNVASGVYFYRLQAGDLTQTKKMILVK